MLHKTCLTPAESHVEHIGFSDNCTSSTYCYTYCPRCKQQVYLHELLIGNDADV